MNKRILVIVAFIACLVLGASFVSATTESNFIDVEAYESVYKMSEASDVKLPFIKVFNSNAIFDKSLNSSGLSIASKTVDIDESISGIQTVLSRDTVNIKGSIEYGIIIANNVVISGTVEKDVMIIANSVFITDTAVLNNDAIVMAKTIELKGAVNGNFIAFSDDLLMNGIVKKDFRVASENLRFGEYDIDGEIYLETESNPNISERYPNAVIKIITEKSVSKEIKRISIANTVRKCITGTILFALLNLLIVKIRPNMFNDMADKFKNNSSYAIIMAVLGFITMPIIITILLILSLIGLGIITIPAILVYIILFVVIISLAKFITGSVIYELYKDKLKVESKFKRFCVMLGIYACLYILCNIPVIGGLITMATVLFSAAFVITGITKKKEIINEN